MLLLLLNKKKRKIASLHCSKRSRHFDGLIVSKFDIVNCSANISIKVKPSCVTILVILAKMKISASVLLAGIAAEPVM